MMSENINLLIGIPENDNDYELMVNAFINSKGHHIICGIPLNKFIFSLIIFL